MLESTAQTTAHRVTGLTNGREYRFRIRAVNRTGEGPRTGPLLATPRAALPAMPAGVAAAAGDGEVSLRWVDPLDASITGYQYSLDGGSRWTDIVGSGPDTTSHTVAGLTNGTAYAGTAYAFAVRAVNATGNSPFSIAVSATPRRRRRPSRPVSRRWRGTGG